MRHKLNAYLAAALAMLAVAVGAAALGLGGCAPEGPPVRAPKIGNEVPLVRVHLGDDAASLVVAVRGPWRLTADSGEVGKGPRLDWTLCQVQDGEIVFGEAAPVAGAVELAAETDGTIWVRQTVGGTTRERAYRGSVRLGPAAGGVVRVVNTLPLEAYVAGVLANELVRSWHVETYKALAVAARTYALQERSSRGRYDADVHDSTASQVYGGCLTETLTAWEAVERTWGIVGTYRGPEGKPTLLRMYYSSTCGGMTASAAEVSSGPVPPPLVGGVSCTWCRQSPKYRWPDVALTKREIADGQRRSDAPELASLGPVDKVEVAERDGPNLRATLIRIVGASGKSVLVRAANWRSLVGAGKVPSTWFDVEDAGDRILLKNGHGYGHGVGLCQWGAEFLAARGKTGEEILRYYYPGVELVRAY